MFASWLNAGDLDARLDPYRYAPEFISVLHRIKSSHIPIINLEAVRKSDEPINYGIIQPLDFVKRHGVPMISASNLTNPLIDRESVVCVSRDVESPYKRSRLKQGDILISIAGTLGAIGVCPAGWSIANINRQVARLRVNDAHDPHFIAAFLMAATGQLILMREAVGTVQRHFNLEDLPGVLLPSPGNTIELAIGNKVRKAERLQEQAEKARSHAEEVLHQGLRLAEFKPTYEQHAWTGRELFTSARSDAEFYQSQYIALEKHLRDLEQSGLEVARLSSMMKSGSYGVLPSSDDYGKGDLPFLRAQDLGHYILETNNPIEVPRYYNNPKAIAHAGDLLLEVKGNIAAGAICPPYADGWLVNGSIYRMSLDEDVSATYVLAVLLSPLGELQKKRAAANSIISYLSLDFLNQLQIPRLSPEEEQEISSSIGLYSEATMKMRELIIKSKSDVEALIDDSLDEEALLREGAEIERWLKENSSQ